MHIVLVAVTVAASSAVCSFFAYYAGVRTEQILTLAMRRDLHRLSRWCEQLRDANHELLAENASLRAGEEPLSPREMITLSEIEAYEWESDR